MSNELKIKDINNKLKEKVKTSWDDFLIPYIESLNHFKLMDVLLNDLNQNIKFKPAMKDWFVQFNKCDLNNLKVVFITESYYDDDTILNDLRFTSNFSNQFIKTASEQGVLFLTLNRTSNDNIPNSHSPYWFSFNKELIEFICNVNKNTVFIFIGDNTKTFVQYVNQIDSYIIFLNDLEDEIWSNELISSDDPNKSILKSHVNFMLKKHDKLEINW